MFNDDEDKNGPLNVVLTYPKTDKHFYLMGPMDVLGERGPMAMLRILSWFISTLPGNALRVFLFRMLGCRIGKNVSIGKYTRIGPDVEISDDVKIGSRVRVGHTSFNKGTIVKDDVSISYSRIGERCLIQGGSMIHGTSENTLRIGSDVAIGHYWILDGTGGLVIEDHVDTASPAGAIYTHSSIKKRLLGEPWGPQGIQKAPVRVGTCTWIGAKVTIQPGVNVGHHGALMPNSVIIKDVEPYTMVSGVPARKVKRILIDGANVTFRGPG